MSSASKRMAATDHFNRVQLPQGLRRQFAVLEARLWRTETLTSLCAGLGGIGLSWLALFISDRLWDTPVWVRIALMGVGVAGFVFFALEWIRLWILQRRGPQALAVLVQRRYRRLGDRLLGIVELADEARRPAHFSPELYQAAIEQVATEASQFDFPASVNTRPARKLGLGLAGVVGLVLIAAVLAPGAAANVWKRWWLPTAAVPRFTLVSLEGLPRELVVANGERFAIAAQLHYRSLWKPKRVVARFERQPRLAAETRDQNFQLQIPGQVQSGHLRIWAGDARAAVAIRPEHRPSLEQMDAAVHLPSYLQYPDAKEKAESGLLTVLEGSRVAFSGLATRSLQSAELQVAGQDPQPLRVHEARFFTEPFEVGSEAELSFSWRDQLGLRSAGPWRIRLRAQKDVAPAPELAGLLKDTAMLQTEILEIRALARDDYGVREVGLKWQVLGDAAGTNGPASQTLKFQAPTPHEKIFEQVFQFSPSVLQIPPDSVVEVRGFATDFFPGRAPNETAVYRIHVMGNAAHAELVRQNLESLLTRLEEVTRSEEKVTAATKALEQLSKEKLQADDAKERIGTAKDDQVKTSEQLNELAQEAKKVLREAFRNPTFSPESLRDWAKNLQQMQQLADGDMQKAAKSLKSAQEEADARSSQLSQALDKEKEILDELEHMQRQVNKGLDQLQALTLAERLRKVASDEKDIAGRLHRIVPETIGMFAKDLAPRFQNTEAGLADEQATAQKDTHTLQGEIGRFFERTQKDTYGKVNKQMEETHAADELERVRGLIEENVSMDAIQNLGSWADRLNAWADVLQPKSESAGGGGGGGGGGGESPNEALIKELLALLRVRDQEINLRQRTGLLDRQKPDERAYQEGAKALASGQAELRDKMGDIQGDNPAPGLEFPLQDVVDSMKDVEGFLKKPQTDQQTDLAQGKTLERLSDVINLINEQQQRQQSSSNGRSSQSASAEEMAFLMQMMAAQAKPALQAGRNPNGGGSLAGGTTDRAATRALGETTSRAGESRSVRQAGSSSANLPVEFRDALENYFRAVEKMEAQP